MSVTHADLVQRAVRWLRNHHRCAPVFAEMVTAHFEWPDAIGWRMGLSHVVEAKVSRSDFHRDRWKPHASFASAGMGMHRWYLVPEGLVSAGEIPEWCGLAYAVGRRVQVVKPAPTRERWDARAEAQVLTSAIRRMELGTRFDRKTARWEPVLEREKRQRAEAGESASGGQPG